MVQATDNKVAGKNPVATVVKAFTDNESFWVLAAKLFALLPSFAVSAAMSRRWPKLFALESLRRLIVRWFRSFKISSIYQKLLDRQFNALGST